MIAREAKLQPEAIVVIGGGPAGLMAAEILGRAGKAVTLYDRMPTVGRKFLMAGRGGLNLTHSEPLHKMLQHYGASQDRLTPVIESFTPAVLCAWAQGLGQETFIGSSGRVFPASLKASPLLRPWLARLGQLGVQIVTRRKWTGWDHWHRLVFKGPKDTTETISAAATILALGGASWPRLGSDGGWVEPLSAFHIPISPLRPANCGFAVGWSDPFQERFQGQPLKTIRISFAGRSVRGEAMVTASGIEGGAIYTLSQPLREATEAGQPAVIAVDLCPDVSHPVLASRLDTPRRGQTLSNFLRKYAGLSSVGINLLREVGDIASIEGGARLAALIKAVPLTLTAPQPLARAISTAGGVRWDALDAQLMLRDMPGVFAAGEMLDWEAPTGGYLLQACFSTGAAAANGALAWLKRGDA